MTHFYQQANGDFLAIDTATNRYCRQNLGRDDFEGRATAIAGVVGSVCTCGISRAFLRAACRRLPKCAVPAEWRKAIGV